MIRARSLLVFFVLFFATSLSNAQGIIFFKGIKFGMSAEEIAELGGGNTRHGCASAIKDTDFLGRGDAWTYGGISGWSASCMEGYFSDRQVPGVTGMIKLAALVPQKGSGLGTSHIKAYSADELVDIFSSVFGKFSIVRAGGVAVPTATHGGAVMTIKERERFFYIEITSVDYLNKKQEWERRKGQRKMDDAKSDF